ncbi:AMP binding protein [Pisolithus marmoratus]|nr:AMP binding protein [Pisolithus marmoratus]
MTDQIFKSPLPSVPLLRRSIFTHLLGTCPATPDLVGGFPASAPAFIDSVTGSTLSRGALRSFALQLAHSLQSPPKPLKALLDAATPPTILIFSPNSIVWPILLFGAAAAGFRATLANSAYIPKRTQAPVPRLRCTTDLCAPIPTWRPTSAWLTNVPDPNITSAELSGLVRLEDLLGRGELTSEVNFDGERSNDTFCLCYSSGTTGKPKGVETTHYNLTSVMDIVKPVWPCNDNRSDVFFGSLPYYHIYGAVKLLLLSIVLCAPTVVVAGFDPDKFLEGIAKYRATYVLVVPPILVVFAHHQDEIPPRERTDLKHSTAVHKHDLTSVRMIFSGGAPLSRDLIMAVRDRLRSAGSNAIIAQAYGLTETSPTVTMLPVERANDRVGSVGIVLPNLEVRLIREDAGEALTDIEGAGEMWVRGPTIMKGYLNNPTATTASITSDGWFKTGDIAVRDSEGFFTIVDRRKELIKYKASNVHSWLFSPWLRPPRCLVVPPAELESILFQHPDVADAAVIGVHNEEEATELPRAYVVPARAVPGKDTLSFALGMQSWVASRVAPHKKLRGGIVFVEQVPKSASGKILRRELRERAKNDVAFGQVRARARL